VWFGSWKNGVSSFAPPWVKADYDRFPRAQVVDAKTAVTKTAEALSAFSENNWAEDARAFAAVMRHIREVDRTHRVILVQEENEIGIFGDSRDRSPLANKAFAAPVPAELMDYLQKHKDELNPDIRKVWEAAGFKTSGTWEEVFGKNPKGWGRGPRGEAFDHVHDIWKAAAPRVDMYCPDAYMGGQGDADHIVELTTRYTRSGKPFFTVEATDGEIGAAHAFYAPTLLATVYSWRSVRMGLAQQEAGRFEDGKWVLTRYLGGDDSILRYDFANIAAMNQSGNGVRLSAGERAIQRVKVYRYG